MRAAAVKPVLGTALVHGMCGVLPLDGTCTPFPAPDLTAGTLTELETT